MAVCLLQRLYIRCEMIAGIGSPALGFA